MLFVAEIGSCHKGIKSLAHEMIRQSALAGADIAKFQLGHPEPTQEECLVALPQDRAKLMRWKPMSWAKDLAGWCHQYNIEFMASIWSMEGLEVARDVGMKRYKIPYQIEDEELIQAIYDAAPDGALHSGVNIWCKSEYPCYDISDMPNFPEMFVHWLGYSSHMHGYADALLAIVRGAQYIEKHVTLDKTEESIRDNAFALDFTEFAEMVRIGRQIARLI